MGSECGAEFEDRRTVKVMSTQGKEKSIAIVLAAGKGSRMGTAVQKQYLDLSGRPVITYALEAFEHSEVDEVVLVVGQGETEYARKEIVEKYGYTKVIEIVTGGRERYESVYFGLRAAAREQDETYVLIHDGARAFVIPERINACIRGVKEYGACVLGMPVKDTIKVVDEEEFVCATPDRKTMWLVQTPQCFVLSEILEAYQKMIDAGESRMTDDAMVMEEYGGRRVKMIPGGYNNIKITTPEDLILGEAILQEK